MLTDKEKHRHAVLLDWNAISDEPLAHQTRWAAKWEERNPYLREWADCMFAGWRESYFRRRELVARYSWAVPSDPALDAICKLALETPDNRVVEVGAGTGYWLNQLRMFNDGISLIGYDRAAGERNSYTDGSQYFPVQKGDIEVAANHADSALFLCWPPYDTAMATHAARAYRLAGGRRLAYVGEHRYGCTADEDFFDELRDHWELEAVHIPRWDGIYDRLFLARR